MAKNTEAQTVGAADVGSVSVVMAPAFKFKVAKIVTVPLLKQAIDVPIFIRATGPVFEGKKIEDNKDAAHLMNVIDLQTGEVAQIIVPAVLHSILNDTYPDDSHVGKCFQLIKHAKPSGKSYSPFTVNEIEVEG